MRIKKQKINKLNLIDKTLTLLLFTYLFYLIVTMASANLTRDDSDYYMILQKIVSPNTNLIRHANPYFSQRLPGYSIIAIPPYFVLNNLVAPIIKEENILTKPDNQEPREIELLPYFRLRVNEIFFKNIFLSEENSWYEWRLSGALLLTSYILLLSGLLISAKILRELYPNNPLLVIPLIIVFTSPIFINNILLTPMYATLTAFGISAIGTYFLIKAHKKQEKKYFIITGILFGLLALIRPEAIIYVTSILILLLVKKIKVPKLLPITIITTFVGIYLIYSYTIFGTLNTDILKGDLNKIVFDSWFYTQALISPDSGAIFFSTLIILGTIILAFSRNPLLKILGVSGLILLFLIPLRIPTTLLCNQETNCIRGTLEGINLIKSDINRYLIIISPIAVIGLREGIERLQIFLREKIVFKNKKNVDS